MATQLHTQDLPPAGGFPAIRYKRNIPKKGPSGVVLLLAVTGVSALGFYRLAQSQAERRELKREEVWSRIHLVPMLQAELDRDMYRRGRAALEREREIMADVPEWRVGESVYHTKRYVPANVVVVPEGSKSV